jgi:hypothetical protein
VKFVADRDTEEVIGATMVGNSAAEVIHEAAMGLRFHAKLHDFIELLHVYPTMAEALKMRRSHASRIRPSSRVVRSSGSTARCALVLALGSSSTRLCHRSYLLGGARDLTCAVP